MHEIRTTAFPGICKCDTWIRCANVVERIETVLRVESPNDPGNVVLDDGFHCVLSALCLIASVNVLLVIALQ